MEWTAASQEVYDSVLELGRAYHGPQGFPHRWVKSGAEIAMSLQPYLSALYGACVCVVSTPRPSMCIIDSLLAKDMGW